MNKEKKVQLTTNIIEALYSIDELEVFSDNLTDDEYLIIEKARNELKGIMALL